jgi:hypothetical protein
MGGTYDREQRIRVAWPVVRMCGICALAVLFNFFSSKVGIVVSATDPSSFVPLLAPEFRVHLPWLNLWWISAFGMCVAHLVLRRWTPVTRWADWGLYLLAVIVLGRLVLDGPISVFPVVSMFAKLVLGLALIATAFASGQKLYELLNKARVSARPKEA